MEHKVTIENQIERRMNFVEDPKFRKLVAQKMKELGVSPQEWKENAWVYYMYIANEFCAIEDGLR